MLGEYLMYGIATLLVSSVIILNYIGVECCKVSEDTEYESKLYQEDKDVSK